MRWRTNPDQKSAPGRRRQDRSLGLGGSQTLALFLDAKLMTTTEAGGERVHAVPDERRIALEYHKNTVLSFFVPQALISNALSVEDGPLEVSTLRERVERLSRLFKYEFMYRADATFDEIFDDALQTMLDVSYGATAPDWLWGYYTQFGIQARVRTLDEFSDRYDELQTRLGEERQILTYLNVSLY